MGKNFLLSVLFTLGLSTLPAGAASLQCSQLPSLFEFYVQRHYAYKKVSDPIKKHTVDQFVKSIDRSKTMLLESDVAKLKESMNSLFNTMQSGTCTALENSDKLLLERATENEKFVKEMLGKDYKLDENIEFISDPEKRGYPKTVEEKKDILKKMIHFQMSNFLMADMKIEEAKKQLIHRYELITKRIREKKPQELFSDYAEAFASALDPHSGFMSMDSLEDFKIGMQLSLEGIGASLSNQDGFTVIEELIPGGGAEKSKKLRPKDKIMSVAQDGKDPVSVVDMDLREVVSLIRGKKGTKVTLSILRQAETTKTFNVTIVRDKIDMKSQAAKITYETRKLGDKSIKIGVIDLPSFYGGEEKGNRSCSADVKALLEEAKTKKVDGIVLNLSKNGGGLLDEAVKVSGLFIGKGAIVATKDSDSKIQVLVDEDPNVVYRGPLVVLTSRISASASEILAGALKDYKRAVIVGGDHTFGKGSVQIVSGLPLGIGGVRITTGMFFLPGGASTQHVGVESDITLPSVFNTEEIGEKTLDYSLPPQSIPTFVSKEANSTLPSKHWEELEPAMLKQLAEKSTKRVTSGNKFDEIKKFIDESKKNKGVIKLAEMRKKSLEERKANKKKKNKNDEEGKNKELEAPVVEEAVNILADLIKDFPQKTVTTGS